MKFRQSCKNKQKIWQWLFSISRLFALLFTLFIKVSFNNLESRKTFVRLSNCLQKSVSKKSVERLVEVNLMKARIELTNIQQRAKKAKLAKK